jgi:hypothetical protein
MVYPGFESGPLAQKSDVLTTVLPGHLGPWSFGVLKITIHIICDKRNHFRGHILIHIGNKKCIKNFLQKKFK